MMNSSWRMASEVDAYRCVGRQIDRYEWVDGWVSGWVSGWTDAWMHGQMDGWTDEMLDG